MSKKRIFIATSSFGLHSPEIEKLLDDNFITQECTQTGRKLYNKELGKNWLMWMVSTQELNHIYIKILKDNHSLKIISRLE